MKHLIIYSHLNPASFTKAIAELKQKLRFLVKYQVGTDELRKNYLETIK